MTLIGVCDFYITNHLTCHNLCLCADYAHVFTCLTSESCTHSLDEPIGLQEQYMHSLCIPYGINLTFVLHIQFYNAMLQVDRTNVFRETLDVVADLVLGPPYTKASCDVPQHLHLRRVPCVIPCAPHKPLV